MLHKNIEDHEQTFCLGGVLNENLSFMQERNKTEEIKIRIRISVNMPQMWEQPIGEKMQEIYEENQETYEHWFNEKRKNKAQWKLDHPVVKE
jgi:hypothetical protein